MADGALQRIVVLIARCDSHSDGMIRKVTPRNYVVAHVETADVITSLW